MKLVQASVISALFLVGCAAGSSNTPSPPIQTTPVHFPFGTAGPVQLTDAFNNGLCHIRVDYLSTGTGAPLGMTGVGFMLFDHQMGSPKVANLYQQKWGREGEFSTCAQVPTPANIPVLLAELNQILSANGPPPQGIIRISP